MKQISFDTKVNIKLNERGKHLYYLSLMNNKKESDVLQSDGKLITTLEKVVELLGPSYRGFTPVFDALSSDELYLEDEKKSVSLDSKIVIQLSKFGKQLYYLNTMNNPNMKNLISKDDYLLISIRELIKIFGGKLEAFPFEQEKIIIDEQDLLDSNEFEVNTRNRY